MDGTRAAELLRAQRRLVEGRSALYERLLAGLAGAAERGFDGGAIPRLLSVRGPERVGESRLLLLAALHHAALEEPSLPHAAWYATAVDRPTPATEGAPGALALAYLVEHEDEVASFLRTHRLQTNEIGRAAALLPGVLRAAATGLPVRLLELGCSAGLHLRLDRARVRYLDGPAWGPTGGLVLESRAEGNVPRSLSPPTFEVAERRGVDLSPIDPSDPAGRRLLTSFVWPDEHDRHERLRGALDVAASVPAIIDEGDMVAWAEVHAQPHPGAATVVMQAIVRQLLAPEQVGRLGEVLEGALRAATADAPVVICQLEPPRGLPDDAPTWPELTVGIADGDGPPRWRTVLSADWHGRWVRWF